MVPVTITELLHTVNRIVMVPVTITEKVMNMKRLLLVEDDEAIALGLEYSLGQEDFKVITCHDKTSAEKAIMNEELDIALLDISLPDGNGFELCKLLKERK